MMVITDAKFNRIMSKKSAGITILFLFLTLIEYIKNYIKH